MSSHRARIAVLILLTLIGFVAPNAYVMTWFRRNGVNAASATQYFREWARSTPTRALTADLGITSTTVLWWSFVDSRRHGVRHWWLVPAGTASVGICFATPLYLLLRELAAVAD